jgi:hypothetical protein
MKITLNGGNFGGQEIDFESAKPNENGEHIIAMEDEAGVWLYSVDRHKKSDTADFVGMK